MRLRLGLKPQGAPNTPCVCGEVNLAADPTHPLHCKKRRDLVTLRHDTAKQLLAELSRTLGADAQIEPVGMFDSSQRRPDLNLIFGTRRVLVDVSVCHPLAPTYGAVAQHPLGTAIRAEQRKRVRYEHLARAADFTFVPFILETTGGWGPAALALVKALSSHANSHASISKAEATNTLIQGISTAIQRGNAQLILGAYQSALAADLPRPPAAPYSASRPALIIPSLPDLTQVCRT